MKEALKEDINKSVVATADGDVQNNSCRLSTYLYLSPKQLITIRQSAT
jgi:hypothetical protein